MELSRGQSGPEVQPSCFARTPAKSPASSGYRLLVRRRTGNLDDAAPFRDIQNYDPPAIRSLVITCRDARYEQLDAPELARERASGAGQTLNQHFAIAVANLLPASRMSTSLRLRQYGGGIRGDGGADLIAGMSVQSAKTLAILPP